MSYLIKPVGYKPLLDMKQTELGIKQIKEFFQQNLSSDALSASPSKTWETNRQKSFTHWPNGNVSLWPTIRLSRATEFIPI